MRSRWRGLVVLAVVCSDLVISSRAAEAKVGLTFQLCPVQPVAGAPAKLVVETWAIDETGPRTDQPIDMTGYPFDVRVYSAAEFPGTSAPAGLGFPITLEQGAAAFWSAAVVFPTAGRWVIVFRNWFPPLTGSPPVDFPAILAVDVIDPATAAPSSNESCGDHVPAAPFDPTSFGFSLDLVADGFEQPVHVADPGDGSGRLFVVEQAGRIRIVRDGRVATTPFLDITSLVGSGGERGMLSVAFHPGYARNGEFYVDYTDLNGDTRVVRYQVSADDPDRADPASAETILTVAQPARNHNGGLLLFGPDGYLYVGLGDGGGGNGQNGQNLDTLLGKILRIDVDRQENGLPYAIPPDNPFVDQPDARPEIWVWGLRNPWRFGFDRATGDLWIGDVGSSLYEEVNLVPAGSGGGQNFGWNLMEGTECREEPASVCTDVEPPVGGFDRDAGCVVTGGVVYRGTDIPALTGVYLYGDYCSGNIWGLIRNAADWLTAGPVTTDLRISSFGEDAAGEVYVVDITGGLYRIEA